jgi:hypothetical protein
MFTVEELIERLIFASIRLDKYPSLNKSEKDYANREIFRQEWQETVDEATQEFLFMENYKVAKDKKYIYEDRYVEYPKHKSYIEFPTLLEDGTYKQIPE